MTYLICTLIVTFSSTFVLSIYCIDFFFSSWRSTSSLTHVTSYDNKDFFLTKLTVIQLNLQCTLLVIVSRPTPCYNIHGLIGKLATTSLEKYFSLFKINLAHCWWRIAHAVPPQSPLYINFSDLALNWSYKENHQKTCIGYSGPNQHVSISWINI